LPDRYQLRIGDLRGRFPERGFVPSDATLELPLVFEDASGGDIRLQVDRSRAHSVAHIQGDPAHSLDLHRALRALTENDPAAPRIVRLGLLFASDYAFGTDVLGAMFDRGFATEDDPYGADTSFARPREGCAVFLGPISRLRPDSDDDYVRQIAYTAVHELGHVFNLGHSDGDDYMRKSRREGIGRERFNAAQERWLSQCSSTPEVWPGGHRYGGHDGLDSTRGRAPDGLELSIGLSRDHAWPWEPIDLELRLSASRARRVPNELDPGYEGFRVWIEEPDGSRRTYRSPIAYCAAGGRIEIGPRAEFTRDICLFGQSGGYTFHRPGVHCVWIEWRLARSRILVSNCCSIDILGPGSRRPDRTAFLRDPSLARLLFYRRERPTGRAFRALEEASRARLGPTGAQILYSLGRSLEHAWRTSSKASSKGALRGRARAMLLRASDRAELGQHARAKARRLADLLASV